MTEIALLDSDAALLALAPEWEALWRRVPGASPFAAPAWLLPWWRHFGTGAPRVAVRRTGGQLSGVLPLYRLDEPGIRKLLPIGAGTTDHLDALLEPGAMPGPLLQAALDHARVDGVDQCDLIEVPPGSALRGVAPAGWRAEWSEGQPCPVLTLPATVAGLADVVPANTLRKLRMNRNRAARAGGFTIETAGPDTVQALLSELVRLHQARWTAQGEPGALAGPAVLGFHRDAAPALLRAGVLRLQALRIGGVVVAACYALLAGRERILFYLSGFDAGQSFVSPGTLLLAAMLEEAVMEGRQEADFLRGREGYKYAWGGVDRVNGGCRLVPVS